MTEVDTPAPAPGRFASGRLSAPWTAAAAAACGYAVLAVVDPTEHRVTPDCPFRVLTGWWCPFCGGTRAASRLLRGDVGGAFHYNAAFVVLLPLIAAVWAAAAFPSSFGFLDPLRARTRPVVGVVVALLGVFLLARNLPPADSWLRYRGA